MAVNRVYVAVCGLLILAGSIEAASVNPMDKVFQLMDELTAKIEKEGEDEAKAYKEYVDWCDDTATDTKHSIKDATKKKEQLEATIDKAKADAAAAATSIEELTASIASASADLKAASEVRAKEAAEFAKVESELATGVAELDGAITKIESGNVQALLMTLDVMFSKASVATADKSKLMA